MSELTDFRKAKDEFLREEEESPLPYEQRPGFPGLSYYDENPALALELVPVPYETQELVELRTSKPGTTAEFIRWAKVQFDVDGVPVELTVFREPRSEALFLPFVDGMAGRETHPEGRYLEVEELSNGRLRVDFNYAYNPYCALNEDWACPIPPSESHIAVAIRAGERMFPGAR